MPAAAPRRCRVNARVVVHSARGLRAADIGIFGAKSDPYCVCQIEGRPKTICQTEVVKRTLTPQWNFEQTLLGATQGDALKFSVFDYDVVGSDDLLGEVRLPFEQWYPKFDGEVQLDVAKPVKGKESYLTITVTAVDPPVDRSDRTRIYVKVLHARELRAADRSLLPGSESSSDPYCIVRLPGKPQSSFQTKVVKHSLNPEWNEEDELMGYTEGDSIEFQVNDWDMLGSHDDLGSCLLRPERFYPKGFDGWLHLMCDEGQTEPTLNVSIEVQLPTQRKIVLVDPHADVQDDWRWPVPFMLRCIETRRQHHLVAVTHIGRSSQLDSEKDLILKGPGNGDVGRFHAHIKTKQDEVGIWRLRVYDPKGGGGLGQGPGSGHSGGGTSVNGNGVHPEVGTSISPGDVLRFGVNELWMVEKGALFSKSVPAVAAAYKAEHFQDEDPVFTRNLLIPSAECQSALKRCDDWLDFVRVTLEWLQELDEPPCCDVIEVRDERGKCSSRHETITLEDQEAYDVKAITKDIRLGVTVHLRLSSDPCLLAPILQFLEDHRLRLERTYKDRDPIPE